MPRMEHSNEITLNITANDVVSARFQESKYCQIARACKRELKATEVIEALDMCRIDGVWYTHEWYGQAENVEDLNKAFHTKLQTDVLRSIKLIKEK